jgi:hypothetical protein
MEFKDAHVPDEDLLLAIDGELTERRAAEIKKHQMACWSCRAHRQEIEHAVAMYERVHRRYLDSVIPPAAGPRALLKARLACLAEIPPAPSLVLHPPRNLLRGGVPPLWLQIAAAGVIAASTGMTIWLSDWRPLLFSVSFCLLLIGGFRALGYEWARAYRTRALVVIVSVVIFLAILYALGQFTSNSVH